MSKVITLLAYRPHYVEQLLASLARCQGISEYTLLAWAHQPVDERVIEQVEGFEGCATRFYEGHVRNGAPYVRVSEGTYNALSIGFRAAEYVVHLEDDNLLAPDALRYFEWCDEQYAADPQVFSVSAWGRADRAGWSLDTLPPERYHEVQRAPWFVTHGWATWSDRWQEMRAGWNFSVWDRGLQELRGERSVITPLLSRSQNVGHAALGASGESMAWRAEHQHSPVYAGFMTEMPLGNFYEQVNAVERAIA